VRSTGVRGILERLEAGLCHRPQACNLTDSYVCPPTRAWTMAFTHEDGWLGPYFAVHPDDEALNKKNLKQVHDTERKQHEVARARSKGWR
jgi:hypothetical protein